MRGSTFAPRRVDAAASYSPSDRAKRRNTHAWRHARACARTPRRCHTKSVITKPQNVYVMRDIMCSGYVAGGNTRWFAADIGTNELKPPGTGTEEIAYFDAQRAETVDNITKRLSFDDDSSGEYASLLAFACSYPDELSGSRDQVISISDRLLPWEVAKNQAPAKTYFPGGPKNYTRYKNLYQLDQIHFGEDVRATENMAFISQVDRDP